ncbi:hypothetical protein [Saccharopolyspora shandongensis]|uniref:hypothetical protein n=1 Tax=Saccharopolyspora shandongensis TaxID=418495 RepID=UPI0033F2CCEC
MTGIDEALQFYPELAVLLGLSLWTFWSLTGAAGRREWLFGVLNWPEHSDALWIADRHESLAVRLLVDSPDRRGGVVWRYSGTLAATVEALRSLPAPGEPGAPHRVVQAGPFWPSLDLR